VINLPNIYRLCKRNLLFMYSVASYFYLFIYLFIHLFYLNGIIVMHMYGYVCVCIYVYIFVVLFLMLIFYDMRNLLTFLFLFGVESI